METELHFCNFKPHLKIFQSRYPLKKKMLPIFFKPPGFELSQVRGGLQVILSAELYIHLATRAAAIFFPGKVENVNFLKMLFLRITSRVCSEELYSKPCMSITYSGCCFTCPPKKLKIH